MSLQLYDETLFRSPLSILIFRDFFTLLQLLNIFFPLLLEACFTSSIMVIQLYQSLHSTSPMPETAQWGSSVQDDTNLHADAWKTLFHSDNPTIIPHKSKLNPNLILVLDHLSGDKRICGEIRLVYIQHLQQI